MKESHQWIVHKHGFVFPLQFLWVSHIWREPTYQGGLLPIKEIPVHMAAATVIEGCNLRVNDLLVVVWHFQTYQMMANTHSLISVSKYIYQWYYFLVIMWIDCFHLIHAILKNYKVAFHSAQIWNSVIILSVLKL